MSPAGKWHYRDDDDDDDDQEEEFTDLASSRLLRADGGQPTDLLTGKLAGQPTRQLARQAHQAAGLLRRPDCRQSGCRRVAVLAPLEATAGADVVVCLCAGEQRKLLTSPTGSRSCLQSHHKQLQPPPPAPRGCAILLCCGRLGQLGQVSRPNRRRGKKNEPKPGRSAAS